MAGKYDVTIDQGANWKVTFTWKERVAGVLSLVNLTGYTARAEVRSVSDNSLLMSASTVAGTITLGGAAGTVAINVPAATTGALTAQTARWDLELTSASGEITRLVKGLAVIDPQVTTG